MWMPCAWLWACRGSLTFVKGRSSSGITLRSRKQSGRQNCRTPPIPSPWPPKPLLPNNFKWLGSKTPGRQPPSVCSPHLWRPACHVISKFTGMHPYALCAKLRIGPGTPKAKMEAEGVKRGRTHRPLQFITPLLGQWLISWYETTLPHLYRVSTLMWWKHNPSLTLLLFLPAGVSGLGRDVV